MFNISYKELTSSAFIQAMNKISNCTDFKMKVAYRLMMISKDLQKAFEGARKEFDEYMSKFAEKDDKGIFKRENNTYVWKDGVSAADGEKAVEEFHAKTVAVDKVKLSVDDLQPAKLSAVELGALEPLLHTLEGV